MSEWQQGDIAVNGGKIHYHRTGGDKPSLILAHGVTDNGLCWSRVARVLEKDFDIVMFDARGHGESDRLTAFTSGDHADDLAGVTESLGLIRPALMGHSMGARSVASAAARYPELVSKIVLEDPPFLPPFDENDKQAKAWREGFRNSVQAFSVMTAGEIADFGKAANPGWHADEFSAWAESKRQVDIDVMSPLKLESWQDVAKAIRHPALLIYADRDKGGIIDEEIATEATRLNAMIEARHISGAGHNVRREQFDAFMAAVTAFLVG